jgi:hypothetical protein
VTPFGVDLTAVLSSAGYSPILPTQQAYGQMKANSRGDMLACSYYGSPNQVSGNRVEVYGFNNSTGQVTSATSLGTVNGVYGVEFSQSGRYVYASTNPGVLFQWDLCAANIQGSRYQVANVGAFFGSLQIAKDGKIYAVRGVNKWISRIANPEVYGGGCGFVDQFITTPTNSNFGLPNFAPYYVYPPPIYFSNSIQSCNVICFTASPNNVICTTNQTPIYKWTLHDGIQYGSTVCTSILPTSQQVMLELIYPCRIDTIIQNGFGGAEINAFLTIN